MTISSTGIKKSQEERRQYEKSVDEIFSEAEMNAQSTIAELDILATKAGHEAVEQMRRNDAKLTDLAFSAFRAISVRN
jgi:hypothetical protein